jgi:hypothetical protein
MVTSARVRAEVTDDISRYAGSTADLNGLMPPAVTGVHASLHHVAAIAIAVIGVGIVAVVVIVIVRIEAVA